MMWRRPLLAVVLALASYSTLAQKYDPTTGQQIVQGTITSGAITSTTTPLGVTSTQTNGTLTTAGTFQSVLASSGTRKGCLVFNNNAADYILVFFGANGSATTSNAIKVVAGASISCASGVTVLQDNVSATGQNNSDTYVVVSQ